MLLPVEWLLAADDSGLVVDFEQILGLLVDAGPLQLVDDLAGEDLI